MGVFARIRQALSFTDGPTTLFALIIYASVFVSVLVTDELPSAPSAKRQSRLGLNLTTAYRDLHSIAARPHPFATRANDDVREYLLDRLQSIASGHNFITIDNDLRYNASWGGSNAAIYYESTNLLVKVDGTDADLSTKLGAVLFSAHYDSVSTAPGATDDGMGIATMVSMVEYLANNRPKRTAVFNFNNGEEDGLHGAHTFMEHPWSSSTKTFINLEGAASGGRPLLFRSTSLAPLGAFSVPHPHASVLSADAYASGVVRSFTDYSVYTRGNGTEGSGMEGLDFSFYKGRSKYHTRWDAIPHMDGGRRSLWAMMESTRVAGLALLNGKEKVEDRGKPAVYFDLFGRALISIPVSWMFIFNIALLAIGPIAVLALLLLAIFTAQKRRAAEGKAQPGAQSGGIKGLILALLGWVRFWVALAIAVLVNVVVFSAFVKLNPFVVHSHSYLILAVALCTSYLSLVLPLRLTHLRPTHTLPPGSARQQKLATLLEIYALTWVFLLVATIIVGRSSLGSVYYATVWNGTAFLGTVLGLIEAWIRARGSGSDVGAGVGQEAQQGGPDEERRLVRGVRYEVGGTDTGATVEGEEVTAYEDRQDGEGAIVETEPTEITPLMAQHRNGVGKGAVEEPPQKDEMIWWIIQMLVVIPFPLILISQVGLLLTGALSQTLIDGSSAVTVYAGASAVALLALLPLAPFAHKMHRSLTIAISALFVLLLVYGLSATPFTPDSPMKVYFAQSVHLAPHGNASTAQVQTTLTGVAPYVSSKLLPELPSTYGKKINCTSDELRGPGLVGCSWDSSPLLPSPDAEPAHHTKDWIKYTAERTSNTSLRISLAGTNSRACRIFFDSKPVSGFAIRPSLDAPYANATEPTQPGWPIPEKGIKQLNLWSRSWDRTFVVDAFWKLEAGETEGVKGRVACEWAEYESGAAGGSGFGGKIPALEEVLESLPQWALATKRMEGLVEAWTTFEV